MTAPIFPVVAASAAVRAALGTNPVRFYPFGAADQGTPLPYAVWQTVGGEPENYLAGRPDTDVCTLQIDVYAADPIAARAAAMALRDAIELHAHITLWLGDSKNPGTGHWRFAFRVDWITPR